MILPITLVAVRLLLFLYIRYVPVFGILNLDIAHLTNKEETCFLDVRNYNEAVYTLSQDAIHIPYAYLKRYHHEFLSGPVVVLASDTLTKNLSIRFLKRHGIPVVGFYIVNQEMKMNFKKKKISLPSNI